MIDDGYEPTTWPDGSLFDPAAYGQLDRDSRALLLCTWLGEFGSPGLLEPDDAETICGRIAVDAIASSAIAIVAVIDWLQAARSTGAEGASS